jgi:hypothetical protein
MLWILLGISFLLFVLSIFDGDDDSRIVAGLFFFPTLIALIVVLSFYNDAKTTSKERLEVLTQYNTEIINELKPMVDKYLDYEKSTYSALKPNANTLLALSAYPEIKSNEFVMKQINVYLKNQEAIKEIKISIANLKSYKFWIFMN